MFSCFANGAKFGQSVVRKTRPNVFYLEKFCLRNASTNQKTLTQSDGIGLKVVDKIAIIHMNTPNNKVNVIDKDMMKQFEGIINMIKSDDDIQGALLLSSKKDNFIAGANVNMIASCKDAKEATDLAKSGQTLMSDIEVCKKPIVAGIMGTCLGGGFELVLSCHYRIAVDYPKTKFGFPEVMLGLLPGSGGTQRSIKLAPLTDAMDIMLTGKQFGAKKAKKMGLVDQVVSHLGPGLDYDSTSRTMEYLQQLGLEQVKQLINSKNKKTERVKSLTEKAIDRLVKVKFVRDYMLNKVKKQILKKTNGLYPAPLKIIKVIEETIKNGAGNCYDFEAQEFGKLVVSNESKSLISLFNGQTTCKRNPFEKIECPISIGVVGAGLMGAGISYVSLNKGIDVTLKDTNISGLERGNVQISKLINTGVKRRKISKFDAQKIQSNLQLCTDYAQLKNCPFIIEAVFEDVDLKRKIVKDLEGILPKDAIIASNTSALPISEIAKGSLRPENIIGMHYFSPVDKMQLVEIISTDNTSDRCKSLTNELALKQGKIVINVKDSPGFYTTRALIPNVIELINLALSNISFDKLENLTKKLGLPVGGLTLIDEVGIDVISHIVPNLANVFTSRMSDAKLAIDILKHLTDKNLLGRKSGKGFFVYSGKSSNRSQCEETQEIIKGYSSSLNSRASVSHLSGDDLTNACMDRIMCRLVNECVSCLEDGVLRNPVEGDVGAVFGIGFPALHGGPFRYVDTIGPQILVDKMNKFADTVGTHFAPTQMLVDYAKNGKKFHVTGKF